MLLTDVISIDEVIVSDVIKLSATGSELALEAMSEENSTWLAKSVDDVDDVILTKFSEVTSFLLLIIPEKDVSVKHIRIIKVK